MRAAGYQSESDLNGIDGKIEADTNNAQRKTTVDWLNAYNAPHWLQFFASLDGGYQTTNARLGATSWTNQQTGGSHGSNVFGTSWVFDLMVATQQANKIPLSDAVVRPTSLWFAGTGPLGMALNLGISTDYVSKTDGKTGNQDRVNGKDVILGTIPDKNKDSELGSVPDKEAYKSQQWDLANAQYLAGLLRNPNIDNTNGSPDNSSGANQQDQALLDFLSVYSATQKGENGGGWNNINIINSNADTIRTALFGDGTQANGVIDESRVLLGGTAATVGSMMTGESLKQIMGNDKTMEWNQLWVEPLQKAMDEFNINTPQRIAAFLSQVRHESSSLTKLAEIPGPYRVRVLLSTFEGVFLPGRSAQDAIRNPYYAGQVIDGTTLSKRQAAFRNLKAYIQELGLNDLDDVTMGSDDIAKYSNGTSAEELKIGASGDRWTEVIRNKFLDRYLSEDVGNGLAGNGTEAQAVAHNWFGRGLIHMTHKPAFEKFAQYIQDHHPDLVTPQEGKTVKQTLLDNTRLIVDIENNPNSRMLAALSGAWYWGVYTNTSHGPSINTKADLLNFDPDNPTEPAKFNAVSQKVNGNDQLAIRWDIYRGEVTPKILTGGNPYEDMTYGLKQLGISSMRNQGYETKFGINLAKRNIVEISGGIHSLMADMPAPELLYVDKKIPALLAQAQAALNLKEGEFTMWISDMPTQQIEAPAIYLAANTQAGQTGGNCNA